MDQNLNIKRKSRLRISKLISGLLVLFLLSILGGVIKTSIIQPLTGQQGNYSLAPHPEEWPGPVVQVYAARTRGAKKSLAVHTWIATKREGADHYKVSQIIGWWLRRSGTALFSEPGIPDKGWYGNEAVLLLDHRAPDTENIINQIDRAIDEYPWSQAYSVWPGPNSNTFVAWLGLQVPELGLDLPSTAIGKDWRPWPHSVGMSPSGTGIQASLLGLLGISLGFEEGVELNILSLNMELDLFDLALELPGYGRIGPAPVHSR